MALYCDYCEHSGAVQCDACGMTYCRKCDPQAEKFTGCNCPNEECPLHPITDPDVVEVLTEWATDQVVDMLPVKGVRL